ncbi:MAG: flavin reductase [Ruminococcaceae bacterium]|nr:flavin reductase [Oscillospiraceae bacterium]
MNMKKTLFKLTYGLFVLSSRDGMKDNGCIINTVMQVTDTPLQIAVAVNKDNYTLQMIEKSRIFNISVLSEDVPFSVFQNFGFQSGRSADKFSQFEYKKRAANDVYYLTEYTNAFISAKVVNMIDCGTHMMIIGEVTQALTLSDTPSVTYDYYFKNIKPKPEAKKKGYVCKICGYVYEGDVLPEDFICPLCKHPASDFEKLE